MGLAALWLGLALIATLASIWLRISTALSEIVVGNDRTAGHRRLRRRRRPRRRRILGALPVGHGAIVLTFLAGAELDPQVFKLKWKEAGAVGLASFLLPFLGCTAAAYYLLGWPPMQSWLAGVRSRPRPSRSSMP